MPKEFREKYGWKEGESFAFWDKGGVLILRPVPGKNQECVLCGSQELPAFVEYSGVCGRCMSFNGTETI